MKKLFYLLFLLPLAFFASCSDDDEIAQVDFNVTLSGVTKVNNNFYTVVGDTVSVNRAYVTSKTDKAATLAGVRYYLNGLLIPATIQADGDFSVDFTTAGMQPGTYTFGVTASVLQVDKSINTAVFSLPLYVVENKESLPEGAPEIGTYTVTLDTD